nr:hypothetical protein [Tanacetum cinerariifolium]GFA69380.1 hypothetical protein [Tanacetum cinerariifolium]
EGPVTQSVITHNAAYQEDDLDAYNSNYDMISTTKAVLRANLSSYGSYVLFEDINSSTQQDALSMFEQLSNQVTNCNKVNNDKLIANESLSTELERYKELVKLIEKRQNVDSDFGKCFIPQRKLSDEQALHPSTNQSASSPVKIEAP